MMTEEQILPRGSPNALKISALQGYSGKAWTDQPLGLCGWTIVRANFKSIGKNEYNYVLIGLISYLCDTQKSIHILNSAAGRVG